MGILRAIGKTLVGLNSDYEDFDSDYEEFDSDYEDFDSEDDFDEIDSEDESMETSNISFGHAPNDGSYTKISKEVNIQVAGGNNKGSYDVFLHHGDKYIDFQNQWIKIEGKTRFSLNGNTYLIK